MALAMAIGLAGLSATSCVYWPFGHGGPEPTPLTPPLRGRAAEDADAAAGAVREAPALVGSGRPDAPEALLPIDPATEAVSPAYVPPPADPSPHEPLREGDWITRRTGRLAATDDGRRRFEFDDAPEQRPLPAMIVLPNGLLEAMERHGPETLFDVSGEVTRYRDDVFLVIRRAVVVSGGDQEG